MKGRRTLHSHATNRISRSAVKRMLLILSMVLTALAAPVVPIAHAATQTVTTCDESSLRYALSTAANGDTIQFGCDGVISLTPGSGPLAVGTKTLTFDASGRNVTLRSGSSMQVISVDSGGNLTLNTLTVSGVSSAGGAIVSSGTLAVTNSTFTGNVSGSSGGAISSTGTLTVSNSTFDSNRASGGNGGAISASGALTSIIQFFRSQFSFGPRRGDRC